MARYGGIDLGGTKIQAVVVDDDHEVLGSARHPTPTTGGPADVTLAMVESMREALTEGGRRGARARRVRRRLARRRRRGGRHRHERPQPARLGGHVPAGREARRRVRRAGRAVQRRQRRHPGGVRARRRQAVQVASSACSGAPASAAGSCSTASCGRAAAAAGEIGHVVVKRTGARCPCGRIGCMEAYAGRGAMEIARAREGRRRREDVLFEIMEERGKPRLSSGIWQRALERDDKLAHHLIDRAVDAIGVAVASSLNLLDVEAVVIGGGLGLRLGDPYVEKIRDAMMPHLFADHRPPEVLLASLGDLGGAIGATLIASTRPPLTPEPRRARRRSSGPAAPRTPAARPASRAAARGGRRRPRRGSGTSRRSSVAAPRDDRLRVARVDDLVLRAGQHPQRDAGRHRARRTGSRRRSRGTSGPGYMLRTARGDGQAALRRRSRRSPRPARRPPSGRRRRARRGRGRARRTRCGSRPARSRAPARAARRPTAGSAGRRPRCPRARGARSTARRSAARSRPSRGGRAAAAAAAPRRRGRITVTRPAPSPPVA